MSNASSQNPDVPDSEQPTTERPAANTMRPESPRVVADSNVASEPASPPRPSSPPPPSATSGSSVSSLSSASAAIPGIPDDRPELKAAAAFGGGLVFALLLKRLAR